MYAIGSNSAKPNAMNSRPSSVPAGTRRARSSARRFLCVRPPDPGAVRSGAVGGWGLGGAVLGGRWVGGECGGRSRDAAGGVFGESPVQAPGGGSRAAKGKAGAGGGLRLGVYVQWHRQSVHLPRRASALAQGQS